MRSSTFAANFGTMKKLITLLGVCLLLPAYARTQTLLQDLRPGLDGSDANFGYSLNYNGSFYFTARTNALYGSLFRVDDPASGAVELFTGSTAQNPLFILGNCGDKIIVVVYDQTLGTSLYAYDVSDNSFTLVDELDPSSGSQDVLSVIGEMNGYLYLWASDGTSGFELYRTNGTPAGSGIVKDINPGPDNGAQVGFVINSLGAVLGNNLYFAAATNTEGVELWKTDGTAAGTQLVKDIFTDNSFPPPFGSNPMSFATFNNKVYFSAYDFTYGRELWVTDGTAAGTQLVKDLAPGDSNPLELIVYNNSLYFSALDQDYSRELWKSDGTAAGTVKFSNIGAGTANANCSELTIMGPYLYMVADASDTGVELYRTNGSSVSLTAEMAWMQFSVMPRSLKVVGSHLWFFGTDESGVTQVYRTTGVQSGTQRMSDFNDPEGVYDSEPLADAGGCALFLAESSANGREPYYNCGTQSYVLSSEEVAPATPQLSIYPNPATEYINLSGLQDTERIYVYDSRGIRLLDVQHSGAGQLQLAIPQHWAAGMYILCTEGAAGISRQTLLVQRR